MITVQNHTNPLHGITISSVHPDEKFDLVLSICRILSGSVLKIYDTDLIHPITILPTQEPREELMEFYNLNPLPF